MTNSIIRSPFEYDLFSPEVQEDPYALYGHLLAQGPVYYNGRRDFYALARFDDVDAALRDWQGFSSSAGVRPDDLLELQGPSIIAMVPPRHRQLRQVVQPVFLPAQVAQLEPLVEKKALKLMEGVEDRDELDIMDAFVKRLPVLVICELMGLPESDGEMLKHWADEIVECSAADGTTPDSARGPARALRDYFIDQLAERRRRPGQDLISRLVVTADSGEAGALDEAVGMCNLLFEAGNSTTSSLIGNSLFALAEHAEERVWALEHPDAWPGAIEELLRYDAPVQNMSRVLTGPMRVQGVPIPEGATVVLLLGAADRDPRVWDAPNELRLSREPRRNLAFGAGIHHCIGAPLARLEARVALPLLLSAMPEYEVVSAKRAHDVNLHMFKRLVLRPGKC
jgi:cytochrome P450